MSRRQGKEPYLTAQQVGKRLGVAWPLVLREYRLGTLPGRRMRDGTIRFRWSGRRRLGQRSSALVRGRSGMSTPTTETIAARATVVLDAQALDELGPRAIDRLADLVANRLAERRAAGELPLLTVAQAAEIAGVHPETVRRAIRSGALEVAGYAGKRPRLRREDVDGWLHVSTGPVVRDGAGHVRHAPRRRLAVAGRRRVLGEAIEALASEVRR